MPGDRRASAGVREHASVRDGAAPNRGASRLPAGPRPRRGRCRVGAGARGDEPHPVLRGGASASERGRPRRRAAARAARSPTSVTCDAERHWRSRRPPCRRARCRRPSAPVPGRSASRSASASASVRSRRRPRGEPACGVRPSRSRARPRRACVRLSVTAVRPSIRAIRVPMQELDPLLLPARAAGRSARLSASRVPASSSFERAGRSYGATGSSPTSAIRPLEALRAERLRAAGAASPAPTMAAAIPRRRGRTRRVPASTRSEAATERPVDLDAVPGH